MSLDENKKVSKKNQEKKRRLKGQIRVRVILDDGIRSGNSLKGVRETQVTKGWFLRFEVCSDFTVPSIILHKQTREGGDRSHRVL